MEFLRAKRHRPRAVRPRDAADAAARFRLCFQSHFHLLLFRRRAAPVCSVAEVGNTFRENEIVSARREELEAGATFQNDCPKHFYVSPFSELDLEL